MVGGGKAREKADPGPGLPNGPTSTGLSVERTSQPGGESPQLSSGRLRYLQRKGVEYLLSGKRVGVRREQERETPVSGLKASEGRALWKNLRHHTRSQSLGSEVCCPPASDTLLSSSLKQYVHTDTASWRRKHTKDAHMTHARHTHPVPWLTRALVVSGLISGPDGQGLGLPESRGPKEMEHMHPSLLSPRPSLGKAKARARRTLIAPRIKAPTFQASLILERGMGTGLCPGRQ